MRSRFAGPLVLAVLATVAQGPYTARAADVNAAWGYAALGSGIGYSDIVVARTDGHAEVICAGSASYQNSYWFALRFNPETSGYEQVFVSDRVSELIVRIAVADVVGDGASEIVVALETGEIRFYDLDSKRALPGFSAPPWVAAMALGNVTGDGKAEVLLTVPSGLVVYSGAGASLWQVPGAGGDDIAVGQMDDDPSLEIATANGSVVDVATQAVQWAWPDGFGFRIRAADIDGDGRDEVIAAEHWYLVWAYNVELQLPKWSIMTSHDIGGLEVADADCDGNLDVLIGQGQWGSIVAYDPVSQGLKWEIPNPEHGTTAVAVGDADGDGDDDILWGAGASSSGPDHLYVADPSTKTITWQNPDLVGPFIGPELGDVDGDGQPELVFASSDSDADYSSGRIFVLDASTRRLRGISDPVANNGAILGIRTLKLRNVDADPALEILIGTDFLYNGRVEIYDFEGATNTFSVQWTNPETPETASFSSVEAADVDADGTLEIVGGAGSYVYVYGYSSAAFEWQSFLLGGLSSVVRDVLVLSAGGGSPDIAAIVDGGSLYAFDGVTKDALQIDPGSFTALRTDPFSLARAFYVGDQVGSISRYERGPSKYLVSGTYALASAAIDGITPLSGGGFLVGSAGALSSYPSLSGPPSWTTLDYGVPFGRSVSRGAGAHARFFSAGLYGVLEVAPQANLLSIAPSSGPAAGGTTITATGTAFQGGASLFLGDAPATALVPGGATQIQGDTPALPPGTLQAVTVLNPDASSETLANAFFADFLDVAAGDLFHADVEEMVRRRVTAGCGAGNYCPAQPVTRSQMAAFLVRASFGPSFQAPKARGLLFSDVSCGGFAANETEWIANLGITAGCGGGAYCGSSPVTRAQMAVFLLKTLEGSSYAPPPAQGIFADVPAADPFAPWIEELSSRNITAGCGGGNYCPGDTTTRGQMAVFLSRTFFAS